MDHDGIAVAKVEGEKMSVERKLISLRKRLVDAQRNLIMQAADADSLPSANALRQIADLESAIVATETMIEEERTQGT